MDKLPYDIGDKVTLVSRNTYAHLSPGTIVTVIDTQPGIFPPDIYVTVKDNSGREVTGFSWRFEPFPPIPSTNQS